MPDYWSQSSYSTGANATISQAPRDPGFHVRMRSFQIAAASAAGNKTLQVLDGATVVWQAIIPGGSIDTFSQVDIRASPGNTLTVQFTGGSSADTSIAAQGDFCAPSAGYLLE